MMDYANGQDSCGVGLVAQIDGKPSHRILQTGLTALANVAHRGAVGADGKTGDGAGVLTTIPQRLVAGWLSELDVASPSGIVAVGVVFLPSDASEQKAALGLVTQAIAARGIKLLGIRVVPINRDELGTVARERCPEVRHLILESPAEWEEIHFERQLFLARRRIELAARKAGCRDFHLASLSCRTIVFKGMVLAETLRSFYLDLQNPQYECAICLYHQRFSTNTSPRWTLCQPFRFLAHNGEINTIRGNRNWMNARVPLLEHPVWGDDIGMLRDLLNPDDSDSCNLDNVIDLLTLSGRSLCHALAMLLPPAWRDDPRIPEKQKAFYEYHSAFCEPWDGPAAVAATDGRIAAACVDRNGLRPARYKVTDDGLFILGSEVGADRVADSSVIRKGRLGPGEMIAIDTMSGQLWTNAQIKDHLAEANPYLRWLSEQRHSFQPWPLRDDHEFMSLSEATVRRRQIAAGLHSEEIDISLIKMAETGQEPTFSMGVDTPLAVLSLHPRLLSDYFKQRFAQVTNPPIDPIREQLVMSLAAGLGPEQNLLAETPRHCRVMNVDDPVLLPQQIQQVVLQVHFATAKIDCTWPASEGIEGLQSGLRRVCGDAKQAVKNRAAILILSDHNAGSERIAIPMIMAVGAVHHALCDSGQRMLCSLIAETSDVRDPHQLALHFAYGCTAVYPYLAFASIQLLQREGRLEGRLDDLWTAYRKALDNGLMKIMSKMGISVLNSYQGAQIFEAIGIGPGVMQMCFPASFSQIGGLEFEEIAADCIQRHRTAYAANEVEPTLVNLGLTKPRRSGESHLINGRVTKNLHLFVRSNDPQKYTEFQNAVQPQSPVALRHLFDFKPSGTGPLAVEQVEPIESIRRRFTTAAMSLGAISPEAHEAIAAAMNAIGGKSNSGEGGEDPSRFRGNLNGTSTNSKIKQVASGRFGVTAEYLGSAEEIEIKMAQGAKPGEGGQLPGFKVNELIARLRNTDPGVTLISPPPHHDIYSIEDLAQLIYDLKVVNPGARVCVKLVAKTGVGGIAIGVAKAHADVILISGHEGGTGASPLTSINHAGIPWELGLAETHRGLVAAGLRDRVVLRVDGGIRTGRDVIYAALLGADEYNFGTMALIALGCVYVRKCHLNVCPVGIATQDPQYRQKFKGQPDNLVQYLSAVASECKELLAQLGVSSLEQIVGHTEYLEAALPPNHLKAATLKLDRIIESVPDTRRLTWLEKTANPPPRQKAFDDRFLNSMAWAAEGFPQSFQFEINNTDRNIGTRLAGAVASRFGQHGLAPYSVQLKLRGTAGQSLGAFMCAGIAIELDGEANDYVGKGMGGGEIVIRPFSNAKFNSWENVIIGNTVLYGATAGRLFAAGLAAERFCVRNSGATAVVEGCGDHGCEYMTRGTVVILGPVGINFGAGMTGGLAFVYDPQNQLVNYCNVQSVEVVEVLGSDLSQLRQLIGEFAEKTLSALANRILSNWTRAAKSFKKVQPRHVPSQPAVTVALKPVEV